MAIRYKDKQQKKDYEKFADKVMQYSMLAMLPVIILTVFQFTRGVFSFWSIVASVMSVFLFFCARGGIRSSKKGDKGLYYEESYGTEEDNSKALEGGICVDFIAPVSKKSKTIRILIASLLVVISGVLFSIHGTFLKNNPNVTLTTAYVLSQEDKTWYEYDRDSDGETTVTEHAECDVTLKFMFNGEYKEETVRFYSTGYVASDSLKVYLDENGKFKCTYDSLSRWNGVGILLIICAVALIVSSFVKIGNLIIMPIIFTLLGGILMIAIGGAISFIEMILHEMTCFFAVFALLGVSLFIDFFIVAFTIPKDIELIKVEKSATGAKVVQKGEKGNHRPFDGAGARIVKSANNEEGQISNGDNYTSQSPIVKVCPRCGAKVTIQEKSADCPYCGNHLEK
ncbi:MAG: hypothetical protein IKA31_05285 [Clostridia bacterium]|nr:hypothetical protein [Clostridia bacterium]